MKSCFLFPALIVGASSFAVVTQTAPRCHTALAALMPEDDMSDNQLEIKRIQDKWSEVRHLTKDEADGKLEGDWLEAYNRFYTKYDEDMERMAEIAAVVQKSIEPPKVEKKTQGQKRRDKWALIQAREAARASK